MATLAALSLAILVFIYAGYPLLLALIVRVRGPRAVRTGNHLPSVSLVISAYNEADVIRIKLENTVALDYPRDLLEVVVISDASDDGTDEIAAEYAARHGVIVARQPERAGKTAGLNRTVPTLRGDIVVFSDANALYKRERAEDARAQLCRSAGWLCHRTSQVRRWRRNGRGRRRAHLLELRDCHQEARDGARLDGRRRRRDLRNPRIPVADRCPAAGINDFLNPLQIVNAGWRAIYEPDAICYEDTAGTSGREYRRRVRIVSRSWRAVFQAPGVLNPFRTGWFAFSLVSHKMLRWLTGGFVAAAASGVAGMILERGTTWPLAAAGVAASSVARPSGPLAGSRRWPATSRSFRPRRSSAC